MRRGSHPRKGKSVVYSDPDGRGCAIALLRLAVGILTVGVVLGLGLAWLISKAV